MLIDYTQVQSPLHRLYVQWLQNRADRVASLSDRTFFVQYAMARFFSIHSQVNQPVLLGELEFSVQKRALKKCQYASALTVYGARNFHRRLDALFIGSSLRGRRDHKEFGFSTLTYNMAQIHPRDDVRFYFNGEFILLDWDRAIELCRLSEVAQGRSLRKPYAPDQMPDVFKTHKQLERAYAHD